MTVWAKTHIVCTKTETHFIVYANTYTQEVSMHSVTTGPDELVCFPFYRSIKSQVSNWCQWRALIECCGSLVKPDCYLVILYWVSDKRGPGTLMIQFLFNSPPCLPWWQLVLTTRNNHYIRMMWLWCTLSG